VSAEPRIKACFVVLRWRRLKPTLLNCKGAGRRLAVRGCGTGEKNERAVEASSIVRGVLLRWHRQECLCYRG
jgi:hypothetical protein